MEMFQFYLFVWIMLNDVFIIKLFKWEKKIFRKKKAYHTLKAEWWFALCLNPCFRQILILNMIPFTWLPSVLLEFYLSVCNSVQCDKITDAVRDTLHVTVACYELDERQTASHQLHLPKYLKFKRALFNTIHLLLYFSFSLLFSPKTMIHLPFFSFWFFSFPPASSQIQRSSMPSSFLTAQRKMMTSCISSSVRKRRRWVRLPWPSLGSVESVW